MKLKTTTILAVTSLGMGMAQAVTVAWDNGGAGTSWQTGANWDTGTRPATDDDVTIATGDAVTLNPAFGNDHMIIDGGGSVTVSNGSSLTQSSAFGEEVFIDNGTMTLNNASFGLGFSGSLTVLAQATSGSGIFNATDSSITSAGEIWLGSADTGETNQTAQFNLTNSSIDANGGVGIWFWDTDAAGNNLSLNVNGAGSSVEGRIGRRNTGGQDNAVTWETLWTEGILQFNGGNTGAFADHFTTTGTAGTAGYTLTSVPEPSSTALLGLGGLALILRRRK